MKLCFHLLSILPIVIGAASPKTISLFPQTGSPFNNVTIFEIHGATNAIGIADNGEQDVMQTADFLLNTADSESWVERGGFAKDRPSPDSQLQPQAVAHEARIDLSDRAVLYTDVTVRHQYAFTFHRGAGQVGANLGSDFTRRFKEFTVKPGELKTGPRNAHVLEWHDLALADGQSEDWLATGAIQVGEFANFQTLFRFNTGSPTIRLPQEMRDALIQQILASGGVPSDILGWIQVDNCTPETIPDLFLSFGEGIPIQLIELPPAAGREGSCLLPVSRSTTGYVELGEPFLKSVQTHFDSTRRIISFAPL